MTNVDNELTVFLQMQQGDRRRLNISSTRTWICCTLMLWDIAGIRM